MMFTAKRNLLKKEVQLMATTTCIAGNATKANVSATILNAGNHDGNNITNNLTLATNAYRQQQYVSLPPVNTANCGTAPAPITGGRYGQSVAGEYVVKGGNVTTTLAGVSNTTLRSGAAGFGQRRGKNWFTQYEMLGITDWSYVSGVPTHGLGEHFVGSGITLSADHVTTLQTNAVPGEFVYMVTGKTPTQADYAARTN